MWGEFMFFKEYFKLKREARLEYIQRNKNITELNTKLRELGVVEKTSKPSRILICMYKYKCDKDYKVGYVLGYSNTMFNGDTDLTVLWDEFGRLIKYGKDILSTYDVIIRKPTYDGTYPNLGEKYTYIRNFYHNIVNACNNIENKDSGRGILKRKNNYGFDIIAGEDVLFNKVCYKQEVNTIRQDCDLRLVRYLTNSQKQGFGLACEDNTLNGKVYTIDGELVDEDLELKEELVMKNIIDTFKYLKSAVNLLDIQYLFIDELIAYLESENIEVSNCNIAHIILLLSSKIAFTLKVKGYDSDKEVILKCVTLRLSSMETYYDGDNLNLPPNTYKDEGVLKILKEGIFTV